MDVKVKDSVMIGVMVKPSLKKRVEKAAVKDGFKVSPYCAAIIKDHLESGRTVTRQTSVE
jgi:hypothetical protein